VVRRRDVAMIGAGVRAGGAQRGSRRLSGLAAIEDDEACALAAEEGRDGGADARAGAGHHGDLPVPIEHGERGISPTLPVKSKQPPAPPRAARRQRTGAGTSASAAAILSIARANGCPA